MVNGGSIKQLILVHNQNGSGKLHSIGIMLYKHNSICRFYTLLCLTEFTAMNDQMTAMNWWSIVTVFIEANTLNDWQASRSLMIERLKDWMINEWIKKWNAFDCDINSNPINDMWAIIAEMAEDTVIYRDIEYVMIFHTLIYPTFNTRSCQNPKRHTVWHSRIHSPTQWND